MNLGGICQQFAGPGLPAVRGKTKRVCFVRKLQSCHPCSSYRQRNGEQHHCQVWRQKDCFSSQNPKQPFSRISLSLAAREQQEQGRPQMRPRKRDPHASTARVQLLRTWQVHEGGPGTTLGLQPGAAGDGGQGLILDRLQPSSLHSWGMILFSDALREEWFFWKEPTKFWGDLSAWGGGFFTLVRGTEVCISLMQPQMLEMSSLWNA